jgi:hypothetical protein
MGARIGGDSEPQGRQQGRRIRGTRLIMATRTALTNVDPTTTDWIRRASDESLRCEGRYRELVLRMIAPTHEATDEGNGWTTRVVRAKEQEHPSRRDLEAAYDESLDPLPPPIVAYIFRYYIGDMPLKTGSKAARSTWHDLLILTFYRHQLHKAKSRLIASPATRAKQRTAAKFGISVRTLEAILTHDRQRQAAIKSPRK